MSLETERQISSDLAYSLRRYYVDQFYSRVVAQLPQGSLVLDLGGHKESKRGRFDIEEYELRVLYVNLSTDRTPDVQADGGELPFAESAFDAVICGELLEHVPDPIKVLQSVRHALKPGGTLLLSSPFMYPLHGQPYDYARYTHFFWKEKLAELGYQDIEVEIQGSYWSVLVELIRYQLYVRAMKRRPRPVWFRRILANLVLRGIRWAIQKDKTPTYVDDPFYSKFNTGYGVRAIK